MDMKGPDFYRQVYAVVRRIPRGSVSSYGVVALLAGYPGAARMVGYALHALRPESDIPWWRVVNRLGVISNAYNGAEQAARLAAEDVPFVAEGRVDLTRCGWPAAAERVT